MPLPFLSLLSATARQNRREGLALQALQALVKDGYSQDIPAFLQAQAGLDLAGGIARSVPPLEAGFENELLRQVAAAGDDVTNLPLAALFQAGFRFDRAGGEAGPQAVLQAVLDDKMGTLSVLAQAGVDLDRLLPPSAGEPLTCPLIAAAAKMNLKAVEILLLAGANPDTRVLPAGDTALITAAYLAGRRDFGGHGKADQILVKLVAAGADASLESQERGSVLHWALARELDLDTVDALLKAGANINARNPKDGRTPLMAAVTSGSFYLTARLPQRGANVALEDYQGDTALSLALAGGYPTIASAAFLAKTGVGIQSFRHGTMTPLISALMLKSYDVAEFLIEAGADPWGKDAQQRRPMDVLVTPGGEQIKPGCEATAQILVKAMFAPAYWQKRSVAALSSAWGSVPAALRPLGEEQVEDLLRQKRGGNTPLPRSAPL